MCTKTMVNADGIPVHIHLRSIGKSKLQGPFMSEPIFSPDGKFMWSGFEWIPSPPKTSILPEASIVTQPGDIRDSVVMGNVNRQITNNVTNNISHISVDDLATAMAKAMNSLDGNQAGNGISPAFPNQINPVTNEEWMDGEIVPVNGRISYENSAIIMDSVFSDNCKFTLGTFIKDSVISDNTFQSDCVILGSVISKNVKLGKDVLISNSLIHSGAVIGDNCILSGCEIHPGSIIPSNTTEAHSL